jgi:hypothetical protein
MQVYQLPAQESMPLGTDLAYLKESFQPPDLEDAFANQDNHLEYAPPFDSTVCTLCRVPVGSFSNNNVRLFVFDLGQEFR